MVSGTDVAIVGAGPYALSLAAHLRARGVEHRVFGRPMQFWLDMPEGINLKSFAFATNVYVPARGYGFAEWCRANQLEDFEPCTMASFARYGLWVQSRVVPHVDTSLVTRVSRRGDRRFEVRLSDENTLIANRVVFATGLSYCKFLPPALRDLPPELVSHTSDHRGYAQFRGKDVAILGGGASAVEAGALIHEAGGRPQIFVRDELAHFGTRLPAERSLYSRMRNPISVLGPSMKSRLLQALPFSVRLLPEQARLNFVKHSYGPSSPWWIAPRVWGRVPIFVLTTVTAAEVSGSRVRLKVHEKAFGERTIEVDHVVAGTGFVSDVDRLEYLDEGLKRLVRRVESAPWVNMNFESSVSGAYFLGPITAFCFGPLYRFVTGAEYAAPVVARHIAGPVRAVTSVMRRRVLPHSEAVAAAATAGV